MAKITGPVSISDPHSLSACAPPNQVCFQIYNLGSYDMSFEILNSGSAPMSAHRTLAPLRQTRWRASTHSRLSLSHSERDERRVSSLYFGRRLDIERGPPPESESEGFPIWLKKCRGEEGSQVGREGGIRGGKSEAGSGFSCLLKHEIVSLSCF